MPEDNTVFTFSASHVTSGILIRICDSKNVYPCVDPVTGKISFEGILRLTENSKYILPMFTSSTIIVAEVVSMPLRQNAEPDSIPR